MSDRGTVIRRLLYRLPDLVWIVVILTSALTVDDLPIGWPGLFAFLAFPSIWDLVARRLVTHANARQQTISWKDPASMLIALVLVALACFLVGWAVDQLAEFLGHWVRIAWLLVSAGLAIFSFIRGEFGGVRRLVGKQ